MEGNNKYDSFNNFSLKSCFPAKALDRYIHSYTWVKNYSFNGSEIMRPVPNGYVEMVIHLNGNALNLIQDGVCKTYNHFLVGLYELDYPARITPQRNTVNYEAVGVKFSYMGLIELLGIRPADITNNLLCLEHFLMKTGQFLPEQLNDTVNFQEKVSVLDTFFTTRIKYKFDSKIARKIAVFDNVEHLKNNITVEGFARENNISYRTLQRYATQEMGVCPKEYLKIKRLNKACKMLQYYTQYTIHEIIHDCGYYDQSHFIHEFKQVFNASPLHFLETCNYGFQISRPYIVL